MRQQFLGGLSAFVLFCWGCSAVSLNENQGSDNDPGTLPATVTDQDDVSSDFDIVASRSSSDPDHWNLTVKSRQGLVDAFMWEWDFGDGNTYGGLEQDYVFSAPGAYLIRVTARDRQGEAAFVLTLRLEVVEGNQPPVADAGSEQEVNGNELVFLYGGGSFDPDSPELGYRWEQVSGPPVGLLDKQMPTARFVTPEVVGTNVLEFNLTVDDGALTARDVTRVTVREVVEPAAEGPTANAGPDQDANVGDLVTLDGRQSTGSGSLTYAWTQLSGSPAELLDPSDARTVFVAPAVAGASEELVFELVVRDGDLIDSDQLTVTVHGTETSCDVDSDGDGVVDCQDGCRDDANKTEPGSCGCGSVDEDADGDGVADCIDECPGEPDTDADGDGVVQCLDGCPNDPNKTEPGVCGCGISDTDSDGNGVTDCAEECPVGSNGDADGDGVADCLDECPDDASKTAPGVCGCGNRDFDSDGDGVPDCNDQCPGAPDVDADKDGTLNCDDECPNDPNKTEPGVCGCGRPDVDSDNDGTLNCNDGCPNDANKTAAGACGCGVPDTDADGNGVADCNESSSGGAYSADFTGLAAGANPPDWLDTGDGNSLLENDALFTVLTVGGQPAFGTSSTAVNIHSHYVGSGSADWSAYEYTGRMRITASDGGVGVTFLSSYPSSNEYYRLRRFGTGSFHISPHNASITAGTTDTGVVPQTNTWYRFRIEVEPAQSQTKIRAKVWAEGSGEPGSWQVDAYDANSGRLTAGTIGVWAMGSGSKYWDDVAVSGLSCDTDADGDGLLDCDDGCPNDPSKSAPGECGCGTAETDSDGDGVPDCNDQCPGVVDADADSDGTADCNDGCPNDAEKTEEGDCGCGTPDTDSDGDGTPDCLEPPQLCVSPSSLNFGSSATTATFEVWNCGSDSLSYTVSDNAGWLSVSPTSGSSSGEKDTITATVDRVGLADGTYEGNITVTPSAGTVLTLAVTLSVGAVDSGWTELTPSADTRIYYVSSSEGSDTNAGTSESAPFKTIAKGKNMLRDGYPDWLLLKRGDVWNESLGSWSKSGRSATEPMVVAAFGSATARPLLRTGTGHGIAFFGNSSSPRPMHLAFMGLHFRPEGYTGAGDPTGVFGLRGGENYLFEDCLIEGYKDGISLQGNASEYRNIRFRRCIVVDSYSTDTHAQGIFANRVHDFVIEECLFDHNGWREEVPGAEPTKFNHNFYIQVYCSNVTLRRNIIARASSHGISLNPTGLIEENLVVRNAISVFLRAAPATARNNVVLEGKDIDAELLRGMGIKVEGPWVNPDPDLALVEGNIVAHKVAQGNHKAIDAPPEHAIARDNLVYDWGEGTHGGSYVDPERTVATYHASLGGEASLEAFLEEVRQQSRMNWRPEYTADAVNDYIREGFTPR